MVAEDLKRTRALLARIPPRLSTEQRRARAQAKIGTLLLRLVSIFKGLKLELSRKSPRQSKVTALLARAQTTLCRVEIAYDQLKRGVSDRNKR